MLFLLSKLINLLINPVFILILLSIITLILFLLNYKKKFQLLSLILSITILIIFIIPIGNVALRLLEKDFYDLNISKDIDGVLILGGVINSELTTQYNLINTGRNSERLLELIRINTIYPDAKIIFSGGNNNYFKNKIKEADIIKDYLEELGIDTSKMIFENKSRNTYENILFSKKLVNNKETANWFVLTSAYHMKRSLMISKYQNWNLKPYPVDFRTNKINLLSDLIDINSNFQNLKIFLHEIVGIIFYYFMYKE